MNIQALTASHLAPWPAQTNELISRNIEAARIPGLINLAIGLAQQPMLQGQSTECQGQSGAEKASTQAGTSG
ncbi:hypothetical protein [Ketogulonicigenium robustum]|uniref:hypothetical protein n=1 Tax=Ketogulonicigenium robustum TaxID=92947 RepID=UPI0012F4A5F3|nr:hypothetical protein [Ketogulonicigenium robustum]